MNLRFDLPAQDADAAGRFLKSEIEYCVPADISLGGKLADGRFVIGGARWAYVQDGRVLDYDEIANASEYRLTPMIGNACLEMVSNGRARILMRVSMKHLPRYTYIVQILNSRAKGGREHIYEGEEEQFCPKCGRPIFSATGECPSCAKKSSVFKKILRIAAGHKGPILFSSTLLAMMSGVNMINPYFQKYLIDSCFTLKQGFHPNVTVFAFAVGALIATTVVHLVLNVINSRVLAKVSSKIAAELRQTVFEKVQNLSIGFLTSQRAGDIINRITADTDRIRNTIVNVCGQLVRLAVLLVGVSILMFFIDWRMALVILLPAPLVAYLQYFFWTKILRRLMHRQWKIFDRSNSLLHDVLGGIRVVKAFGREGREVQRFVDSSEEFAEATIRTETIYSVLSPISNFIMKLGLYVVLFIGSVQILNGNMTIGLLVQFTAYINMVYDPLSWLVYLPRMLGDASVAFDRIFSLIDEKPEVENRTDALKPQIRGHVRFENVTFGYKSYEPVLREINLDVKPGEMIGLVGHSGAGKSTLVNLVMRFYDVNEGCVTIDGLDVRDIDQQTLCSQIGVVLQEPFLFQGTILDNIRYSRPTATEEDVIAAAKTANAHDFITAMPDGYDTKLTENGGNLSGGERQRISIARAVLNNPRILILDEATSALDTETESLIQEALQRLTKSRTTFAIAHRLATLKNADRLVVLDQGRIAETGTHDELLRRRGIYYNLVMAQREMSKSKVTA